MQRMSAVLHQVKEAASKHGKFSEKGRFSGWHLLMLVSLIGSWGTFMRPEDTKAAQPTEEHWELEREFERFILWQEWWDRGLMNSLFGLSWGGGGVNT